MENQDAIDAAIVGMLADPKEVCELIRYSPYYAGRGEEYLSTDI